MTNPYPPEYADLLRPDGRWWLAWLPRTEVLRQLRALWSYLLRMEKNMADNTELLHDVADGLRDLGPKIAALVAENTTLRGEDAAESSAASDVKAAFDGVAHLFEQEPAVPTPDPVPSEPTSPDAPADGGDAPAGGDAA